MKTEMRLDPLSGRWTLFAPEREARPPLLGARDEPKQAGSPFTAGREEMTPPALLADAQEWKVRVVPNRAPALRVEGDPARRSAGFYDAVDGVGAHEIVVEHPGGKELAELPVAEVQAVIAAWKSRMLDLARDPRMRSFFVIKNAGEVAGATVSHSISQVIAMALVPPELKNRLRAAREFYLTKKRSIFGDILAEEVRVAARLVHENNGFAVFCPYASRAPFELTVFPKRQVADFHGITDQEAAQLADALKTALGKLDGALGRPAFNLMLYTAPTRTPRRDQWNTLDADFRWHIEIVPKLQRTGGLELATGCHVNTVWPEAAAEYLRGIEL